MESKPWYQSKTLWVNMISGVAFFLEGEKFTNVIPDKWQPFVAMFVFGLNVILRYVTTTEIQSITGPKVPMWLIAVLSGGLFLTGCAHKPPAVVIGQAGVITVDSIHEIQLAVQALNLPPATERKIQVALLDANSKLAPVPDLIIAIDNATKAGQNATNEVDKALAYLAEGAKYIDSVSGDLKAVPTAAAVISLVVKVQTAITTTQQMIERVKAPVPKAQINLVVLPELAN